MQYELYHHGILGMHWGIRRYQNPDGSLTPAGRRRIERKDVKWAKRNYNKIEKKVSSRSASELMDYKRKELDPVFGNNYTRSFFNAWNKKMAEIMTKNASDIKAPSGRSIKFVAKRGEYGVMMAIADEGYDMSQFKNGLWSSGRIAYKKKTVNIAHSELEHHGILGQKWGKRNGPPYPLSGGDYSPAEKAAKYHHSNKDNSLVNKRHFDKTIHVSDTLSTLSRDPNRTKNTDMFYATYKKLDSHYYNAFFNQKAPEDVFDKDGNKIGSAEFLKYRINNKVNKDMKVASEDSGAEVFASLYKNNRDFYNFVTDKERMQTAFVSDKFKFRGYREARDSLDKIRDGSKQPSFDDVKKAYRMFNYVIPYANESNGRLTKDVATQRARFFAELKKAGYGAVLDTNDAIYGGFKREAPVIVFDMQSVVPAGVRRTSITSKRFSELVSIGARALGK